MTPAIRPGLRWALAAVAGLVATVLFAALVPVGWAAAGNGGGNAPSYYSPPISSPPAVYDVEIKNRPKLRAQGQAAQVNLRVECPADVQFAEVDASVRQLFVGGQAFGFESKEIHCTGAPQTVRLIVFANEGEFYQPFRARDAVIRANLFAVDRDGFPRFDEDREVRKLRR